MKQFILFSLTSALFFGCSESEQPTTESTNPSDQTTVLNDEVKEELLPEEVAETETFNYDDKGFENIDFRAYVSDPDPKGPTNVRDKPNGAVLVPLDKSDDYMVDIIGQKDGWFEISSVTGIENVIDLPTQSGWIHNSVLAVSTANYGNQKIPVYLNPDNQSESVTTINQEMQVWFTKIYKEYVFINFEDDNGNKIQGWVESKWLCGNPVTNCS